MTRITPEPTELPTDLSKDLSADLSAVSASALPELPKRSDESTASAALGPAEVTEAPLAPAVMRALAQAPLAGEGIDPEERIPRSFHLSRQLLERARAAAYWVSQLPGVEEASNVSELVERALRREVERLELEYNDGRPFPAVMGRMRTGPGAAGAERIRKAQRARRRTSHEA